MSEEKPYYSQHEPSVSSTKEYSGLGREGLCLKTCSQSVSGVRMSQRPLFHNALEPFTEENYCQNHVQPERPSASDSAILAGSRVFAILGNNVPFI